MPTVSAGVLLAFALPLLGEPARAADRLDSVLPVRGLCIPAPSPGRVEEFVRFIETELAPRGANVLILRVDYNFQFTSRPEMRNPGGLSKDDAAKLSGACRKAGVQLIPLVNLLGHQSWSNNTGRLLKAHPEFDETPWVTMPAKYSWPNADKLYCKSYCPLHPQVHEVVFALVDEVCDAFEADAFHAGLDEVFYLGESKCPRCAARDKAELFAEEVTRIHDHLARKNRRMWMWGDRLLDGKTSGLGEWEASANGTHRAVDLIPKDVTICDWHYERPTPTVVYFAMKGLDVVVCPWKKPAVGTRQLEDVLRFREQSPPEMKKHLRGILQTVWSGADSFMDECNGRKPANNKTPGVSESQCFRTVFDEIGKLRTP